MAPGKAKNGSIPNSFPGAHFVGYTMQYASGVCDRQRKRYEGRRKRDLAASEAEEGNSFSFLSLFLAHAPPTLLYTGAIPPSPNRLMYRWGKRMKRRRGGISLPDSRKEWVLLWSLLGKRVRVSGGTDVGTKGKKFPLLLV